MMVLKAGSISTLDIIAGIKRKVVEVKDSLPDALKIGFIGDQSLFVRGAITGVAYEGVIAALLWGVARDVNMRSAFLHMAGDAGVSAGVLVAAFVITPP